MSHSQTPRGRTGQRERKKKKKKNEKKKSQCEPVKWYLYFSFSTGLQNKFYALVCVCSCGNKQKHRFCWHWGKTEKTAKKYPRIPQRREVWKDHKSNPLVLFFLNRLPCQSNLGWNSSGSQSINTPNEDSKINHAVSNGSFHRWSHWSLKETCSTQKCQNRSGSEHFPLFLYKGREKCH